MYPIATLFALCFISGISGFSQTTEFHLLRLQRQISANESLKAMTERDARSLNIQSKQMSVQFTCEVDTSPKVPTSVHKLRPSDINVVAAMGDSVTAGHGVLSQNLVEVILQDRGNSWSIGGVGTLDKVITLPNILKKFNPKLTGWSTDTALRIMWESRMNVAEAGNQARHMAEQAEMLIESLKDDELINFNTDWKLVTLFIGGNDICKYCHDRNSRSPANYAKNIQRALDMLHAAVPRMMVNIVVIFDVTPLIKMSSGWICDILQDRFCPCSTDPATRGELPGVQQQYYAEVAKLIDSGRYDTREDFTVVMQPFTKDLTPPKKPGTDEYDPSYLTHDCFHPSGKAHAAMAVALWDSMLIPVGKKPFTADHIVHTNPKLRCPTKEHPYIFTSKNSGLNTPKEATNPKEATDPKEPVYYLDQSVLGKDDHNLPGCANCGRGEIDPVAALTMIIIGGVVILVIASIVLGVVIPKYKKRKAAKAQCRRPLHAAPEDNGTTHDNEAFAGHV